MAHSVALCRGHVRFTFITDSSTSTRMTLAAQKRGRCYDSPRDLRGQSMKRFIEGADRAQSTLLPEYLDDFIDESNPVRAVDAFVDALNLGKLGFDGVAPAATGRPAYHPSALL